MPRFAQLLSASAAEPLFPPRHAFADSGLSANEARILLAATEGNSNKAIARRLNKSEFTVRNQLSSAFRKLGVTNRVEAIGLVSRIKSENSL
jgi:two-component system, NarL family, nitrate/nitrite response regulator NarL